MYISYKVYKYLRFINKIPTQIYMYIIYKNKVIIVNGGNKVN